MGDDQEHTRQILADLINHPNAGGVLVLGLGCENSNIEELKNTSANTTKNAFVFWLLRNVKMKFPMHWM